MPDFGSVELCIEKRTGNTCIANQTYMPTINIGNSPSNSFGNFQQETFEFDITEQGDYAIAIYSAASEWSDCIIGQLSLTANDYTPTGISAPQNNQQQITNDNEVFDLQGRRVNSPTKAGIYIKNAKKILIK